MSAVIIDGRAAAARIRDDVARGVADLKAKHGVQPGLAVVLVGDDAASQIYVRNKVRQTSEAGMRSIDHVLPAATSETELLTLVARLNADLQIHGILVQLPLPTHINARRVIEAIDPGKDVDGFHPVNAGKLAAGLGGLVPCTPMGCLTLIKSVREDLVGLDAVVIGRSNIVGRPMAQLLLNESCTVTVSHSKTRDLPELCRRADILVAAAGRPELIRGDWIKPGSIVIDVGINRTTAPGGAPAKARLVGDVAFAEASAVAAALTPVPDGVGPMTIACLLGNTLECARRAYR